MTVGCQKEQGGEQVQEVGQHRGLPTGVGVEEDRERQAHLHADQCARHVHRGEHDAHHEADGDADEHLLREDRQPQSAARRHLRHRRQHRQHRDRHAHPDRQPHPHRHAAVGEHRRRREQPEQAREREHQRGEPGVELGGGDFDHERAGRSVIAAADG